MSVFGAFLSDLVWNKVSQDLKYTKVKNTVFPLLNHKRTQWYNNKTYRFKITKVERFFMIKILHNHKFHLQLRPAMGWHQCHLIVVSALLQLQHLFLTFVKLLLPMSFFFVFLSLLILQYNYSVVCTSVGYKQLTRGRIKFLVLLTFTFASRTNPSLPFSNSTTISNLPMSRHQTLPKLLQFFSRRPSKYSRYHNDQKCSTIFCNVHSFSHKSLPLITPKSISSAILFSRSKFLI